MRDVVKTNVRRNQNSKRTRRRRRHSSMYFFLILILVLGIGVLLSVTLFFNINKIDVKGNVDYSSQDIINVSGIGIGDNMVRLDAAKAEQNILNSMVYIEEADISKHYPDTLEINVTKCVATASVQCENGYLLVSKKGKILEKVESAKDDIMVINGFEPSDETVGTYLSSADEQKTDIFFEITDSISDDEKGKIKSVDMTDKYDIKVNFDNRITFELGNANDVKYKLSLADTVLKDLGDDKKGTMVMIGSNQISFRSDSDSSSNNKKNNDRIPINSDSLPEGTTEETTENPEADVSSYDTGDTSWEDSDSYSYDDGYSEENYDNSDDYYSDNYDYNTDENADANYDNGDYGNYGE